MKLSVAMCTYNGASYVEEQLDSFAAQSRLPDELVVCDDRSTDGTPELVEAFAARAPFAVRLHVNPENLGSTRNFGHAIELCRGDIIALSDQDDVWHPEKLARLEQALVSEPAAGIAFSNAEVVDRELRPLGYTMWETILLDEQKQNAFREGRALHLMLERNFIMGATMAFRSAYKELVLPMHEIDVDGVWVPRWRMIHDGWIATLISAVAKVIPVPEPLMMYRQHERQQFGTEAPRQARPPSEPKPEERTLSHRKRVYRFYVERAGPIHERLLARSGSFESAETAKLGARIRHLQARASLPDARLRRLPPVFKELMALGYHRESSGLLSAAKDLVL
jgi:glycosyltransferase involved in cell wall biosynthesis